MAPKITLSYDDQVKIVIVRDEVYSLAAITSNVRFTHSCVCNTFSRVKETGTLKDRKGCVDNEYPLQGRIELWHIHNRRLLCEWWFL